MAQQYYKTKIVCTQSVNSIMADSSAFAHAITTAIKSFTCGDWGLSMDKALNDSDPMCAMGVYTAPCAEGKIWIKSDNYCEHDGSRVITILFPSEY